MKIKDFCQLSQEEYMPLIMRYLKEKDIYAYYELVRHKHTCKCIQSVKILHHVKYYYFTLCFLTSYYKKMHKSHTFSVTISTPAFLKWINRTQDNIQYIISKDEDVHKRIRTKKNRIKPIVELPNNFSFEDVRSLDYYLLYPTMLNFNTF